MALPVLSLMRGLDRDVLLIGPGVATLNLSSYTKTEFRCSALVITKSTSVATQAEVQASGANLLVHFKNGDIPATAIGEYAYQLVVFNAAGDEFDVAGKGHLVVEEAA